MATEQPDQKVDHVAEARRYVQAVPSELYAAVAQAHAQIAIAEQLQGIREALEGVTEPARIDPCGGGLLHGYLRTAPDA